MNRERTCRFGTHQAAWCLHDVRTLIGQTGEPKQVRLVLVGHRVCMLGTTSRIANVSFSVSDCQPQCELTNTTINDLFSAILESRFHGQLLRGPNHLLLPTQEAPTADFDKIVPQPQPRRTIIATVSGPPSCSSINNSRADGQMGDSSVQANGQRLRFVSSDAVGLPVKRKQVQQACLSCRMKKKKCTHGSQEDVAHAGLTDVSPAGSQTKRPRTSNNTSRTPLPSRPSYSHVDEDTSAAASQLLGLSDRNAADEARPSDPQGRFVGDLNPEGFLIEAAKPVDPRGDNKIGIWKPPVLSHYTDSQSRSDHASPDHARPSVLSPGALQSEVTRLEDALKVAKLKWLDRWLSDVRPSEPDFAKLRDIYLTKIHPIFPIFASRRLRHLGSDRIDTAIRLSVCLAASTDSEAKNYLRLAGYPEPLPQQEYTHKVAGLLRHLIEETDFSSHLLDQIRILACTALYFQPQDEKEWDVPVQLFAQVITIVHSIGLHLQVYDKMFLQDSDWDHQLGHRAQTDNCRQSDIERLFLCIYALDRMICIFHGRPVLLAERDFDKDILDYASRQTPCFRLFIYVIWELNEVIDLYRPSSTATNKSSSVSVFEKLILDSGAENEPSQILATIEVLHHAVSALSVRQTRQAFAPPPEDKEKEYPHLPEPLLNARRSISADRILQIVKQYDVGPLPFIPYGLSIALSVAYRKWRFSKIPMFRTRGRAGFMDVLAVLEEWGRVFASARVNHKLAQKVVEGMEQVADNMRKQREQTPVASNVHINRTQNGARHSIHANGQGAVSGGHTPGAMPLELVMNGPVPITASGQTRGTPAAMMPPYRPTPGAAQNGDPLANVDLSNMENMGSMDWFQLFDQNTNVDVNEMDGMFDRNLDPMAPAFWPEYPAWDPEPKGAGGGTPF